MKFSTDYLTNWYLLTSITQKWLGLIFSLYSIASAREVPFGILQRVQCILQGLTSVHFCITFIFANNESVDLVVTRDGFLYIMEIVIFFIGATAAIWLILWSYAMNFIHATTFCILFQWQIVINFILIIKCIFMIQKKVWWHYTLGITEVIGLLWIKISLQTSLMVPWYF